MAKIGGTRTKPRTLKHLKSTKTRKTVRSGIKKTLKGKSILGLTAKNLERMLGINKAQRRISNIKLTYERTENVEEQMVETANKFIKLFNNILHNEQKYTEARIKIESMLQALNDSKGDPIERHNVKDKKLKSKLLKKISDDDVIRTYRNLLKTSIDVYESSNSQEQRDAASIFLTQINDELYNEFFSKKQTAKMNIENNVENSSLDELLNMFRKSGI